MSRLIKSNCDLSKNRSVGVFLLMAPGMGHIFAGSGYKNGPFPAGRKGQVLRESPNACICSVLRVTWFWQFSEAFRKIVVRVFWASANSNVFENRSPWKCRSDFCRLLFIKTGFHILGGGGKARLLTCVREACRANWLNLVLRNRSKNRFF